MGGAAGAPGGAVWISRGTAQAATLADHAAPRPLVCDRHGSRPAGTPEVQTPPPQLTGEAGAFTPPDEVPTGFGDEAASARVALRAGRGLDLARTGKPAEAMPDDPAGFEIYELPLTPMLVGEVCALGPDAVALAPREFVGDVVAHLRGVAERWPA